MPKEDQIVFNKKIIKQQAKKGYLKFPNKLKQQKYKISLRKLIYRFKVGILKTKQLEELQLKKELRVVTRFAEKNIGKYYKTVARKYFIKNYFINIT